MKSSRNCAGPTRRDCFRLGLGGLFGAGFVDLLRTQESTNGLAPQAKSCILIWQDGGPSHYETFDPKPNAPVELRGEFKPIATNVPGVFFSEAMQRLATVMDKVSVIRSIRHDQGNHGAGNHYMMTGAPRIPVGCGAFVSFHPSMGSVVAAERGASSGMPAYFSLPSMSRSGGPNFLGAKYAPFVVADDPNSPGFRVRDVAIPAELSEGRFEGRTAVRTQVDRMLRINDKAAADPVVALDEHYQQGFQLIASKEAQAAFDIGREPERVRNQYGRDGFGQRALLARRLVEAGVPFITLFSGDWDHHTKLFERMRARSPFEASVAALIHDLHQRGLLATTMVIVLGEFGRTPQINKDGGRDHWSNAMSVLFAGGGAPGGQVIGATDVKGYAASERVLSPENFVSTVYAKLGVDPGKILYSPIGRPTHLVSDPTPIKELMG